MKPKPEEFRKYSSLKSIQILDAVIYNSEGITIKNISDITGLSCSTIHRILLELTETGYTRRGDDNKFLIGIETMRLAMEVKNSNYLLDISKDEMERLNELTGETIHLIAKDEDNGIYIGKVDTKNTVTLQSRVGKATPLYSTSGGKLILAYQDEKWLNKYLDNIEMVPFTNYTITNKKDLLEELCKIRTQGYALDNREYNEDVICIAAPVFGKDEILLCTIGIAAPAYRFSLEMAESYVSEVVKSAKKISEKL